MAPVDDGEVVVLLIAVRRDTVSQQFIRLVTEETTVIITEYLNAIGRRRANPDVSTYILSLGEPPRDSNKAGTVFKFYATNQGIVMPAATVVTALNRLDEPQLRERYRASVTDVATLDDWNLNVVAGGTLPTVASSGTDGVSSNADAGLIAGVAIASVAVVVLFVVLIVQYRRRDGRDSTDISAGKKSSIGIDLASETDLEHASLGQPVWATEAKPQPQQRAIQRTVSNISVVAVRTQPEAAELNVTERSTHLDHPPSYQQQTFLAVGGARAWDGDKKDAVAHTPNQIESVLVGGPEDGLAAASTARPPPEQEGLIHNQGRGVWTEIAQEAVAAMQQQSAIAASTVGSPTEIVVRSTEEAEAAKVTAALAEVASPIGGSPTGSGNGSPKAAPRRTSLSGKKGASVSIAPDVEPSAARAAWDEEEEGEQEGQKLATAGPGDRAWSTPISGGESEFDDAIGVLRGLDENAGSPPGSARVRMQSALETALEVLTGRRQEVPGNMVDEVMQMQPSPNPMLYVRRHTLRRAEEAPSTVRSSLPRRQLSATEMAAMQQRQAEAEAEMIDTTGGGPVTATKTPGRHDAQQLLQQSSLQPSRLFPGAYADSPVVRVAHPDGREGLAELVRSAPSSGVRPTWRTRWSPMTSPNTPGSALSSSGFGANSGFEWEHELGFGPGTPLAPMAEEELQQQETTTTPISPAFLPTEMSAISPARGDGTGTGGGLLSPQSPGYRAQKARLAQLRREQELEAARISSLRHDAEAERARQAAHQSNIDRIQQQQQRQQQQQQPQRSRSSTALLPGVRNEAALSGNSHLNQRLEETRARARALEAMRKTLYGGPGDRGGTSDV